MIHINRFRVERPAIFYSTQLRIAQNKAEHFYQTPEHLRVQKRYVQPTDSVLSNIKKEAKILFQDKCAYCESPIPPASTGGTIDHFRPKSNARGLSNEVSQDYYWWLIYQWENTYLACEICNRYKASWFPVQGERAPVSTPYEALILMEKPYLIDPCVDIPHEHIFFTENGIVDSITVQGQSTIEILKLNREQLVSARANIVKDILVSWEKVNKFWAERTQHNYIIQETLLQWSKLLSDESAAPYTALQRSVIGRLLDTKKEIKSYFETRQFEFNNSREDIQTVKSDTSPLLSFDDFSKKKGRVLVPSKPPIDLGELRHSYIERIRLHNYKCFDDIEISFDKSDNTAISSDVKLFNNEPWFVFLGENSAGKTSILKAVALGLCGNEYLTSLKLIPSDFLKHNATSGFIKLYFKGEHEPVEVTITKQSINSSITLPKTLLAAYNAVRLLPQKSYIRPERGKYTGVRIKNLFDLKSSLSDVNKWVLNLEDKEFNAVAVALKDLMDLQGDDTINRDKIKKEVFVNRTNDRIYIEELSDGYQSVYALAVDIMSTFSKEKVPFNLAEAIILIDEIGTHLHPRWKMRVVKQLQIAFPRMQFIVTTHDPLCLRGLKQGEVAVLNRKSNGQVTAVIDLPDPTNLRVDQLLASPFFGLNSAIDPTVESDFNEYYELLAQQQLSPEDTVRKLELSDRIPKIKFLGDSLREELALHVIDELLAKKTRQPGHTLNIESLKQETIIRVKAIWESLNSEEKANDLR